MKSIIRFARRFLSARFENRTVRGPALQVCQASSCRPRALTRRSAPKNLFGLAASGILAVGPSIAAMEFYSSPIYTTTQAVAAVASGDFDPEHPGNEVACLLADGSVVELALNQTGWVATTIFTNSGNTQVWEDPRQRVTLRVGNVLTGNPSPQLVLSRLQEIIAVYYAPGLGWTNQMIANLLDTLGTSWGIAVGHCDPAATGDQVFFIFEGVFDFSFGTVFSQHPGGWDSNYVYYAEVGMGADIGDSNPAYPGNEIIVTTEMGPTYEILPPAAGGAGPWPRRTLWDDYTNAGWVVKIGDLDPDTPGNEVVYGTRYTDSILMSRFDGTNMHKVSLLFTGINTNSGFDNMLDIAIGKVVPASPGKQILGVDVSGSVYLVQKAENQWQGSIAWHDKAPLYAVLADDLLPTPGDEIVVAGAGGVVTLLSNPSPSLHLDPSPDGLILSWTGLAGVTYNIESTTNLSSGGAWETRTNLSYQGGFSGSLKYTNSPGEFPDRFFRVRAGW